MGNLVRIYASFKNDLMAALTTRMTLNSDKAELLLLLLIFQRNFQRSGLYYCYPRYENVGGGAATLTGRFVCGCCIAVSITSDKLMMWMDPEV